MGGWVAMAGSFCGEGGRAAEGEPLMCPAPPCSGVHPERRADSTGPGLIGGRYNEEDHLPVGQGVRTLQDLLHTHETGGALSAGVWAVSSDADAWARR